MRAANQRSVSAVAVLALISLLLVWWSAPAGACSCAPTAQDPLNRIAEVPYAFVGTVQSDGVRVDHVARGDLDVGDVVPVDTGTDGSCGGSVLVAGEQQAILAYRSRGSLERVACTGATIEELRSYTGELPEPTASGPIAAIVSARWGPATLIAIDASGAPLRYGFGTWVTKLSLCPDSGRFAALSYEADRQVIQLWDTATMTKLASTPVNSSFQNLHCIDAGGTVVVGELFSDATGARPEVLRISDGRANAVAVEPLRALALAGDGSVVAIEMDGSTVRRRGPAPAVLGVVPAIPAEGASIAASADGDAALVTTYSTKRPLTYVVSGGASHAIEGNDARFLADGTVAVYRSADDGERTASRYGRNGALVGTFTLPPESSWLYQFGNRWLAASHGFGPSGATDRAFVEVGGPSDGAAVLTGAFRPTDLVQLSDPIIASTEPMVVQEPVVTAALPDPLGRDPEAPVRSNRSPVGLVAGGASAAAIVAAASWAWRRGAARAAAGD